MAHKAEDCLFSVLTHTLAVVEITTTLLIIFYDLLGVVGVAMWNCTFSLR